MRSARRPARVLDPNFVPSSQGWAVHRSCFLFVDVFVIMLILVLHRWTKKEAPPALPLMREVLLMPGTTPAYFRADAAETIQVNKLLGYINCSGSW